MANVTDLEWKEYKEKFNKNYTDIAEDEMRRKLYIQNKLLIDTHNKKYEAGEVTYSMGINHFSDMTDEEKEKCMRHGIKKT